MSLSAVAKGLRALADDIDSGKVRETACDIRYGAEEDPEMRKRGMMGRRSNGECTITIALRFTRYEEVLARFVANRLAGGAG